MASIATTERPPATPEEIWEILRETAEQQKENTRRWKEEIALREREYAKWREEDALRREEDAQRRKQEAEEDARRRKQEAEENARRRKAEERRREEDAQRRKQEAEEDAQRRKREAEEDAQRRKREAEENALWREAEERRRKQEAEKEALRRKQEAEEDARRRKQEAEKEAQRDKEWKRLSEMFDKTSHRIKENDKRVGGLGRSYGKLVEHLVGPGIIKRFGEHGYHFDDIKKQRYKLCDENGNEETEIDLLLENADTVIAVEVKSRPDREGEYLGRHLLRVEIMRAHSKKEGWEGKRILGAIAGAIFDTPVRNATLKAGFFVIEQSGETMQMSIPEGFKPREW